MTHEVLRDGVPILWVHHEYDGDWAFGSRGGFEVDATSLVLLSHIFDRHPASRHLREDE